MPMGSLVEVPGLSRLGMLEMAVDMLVLEVGMLEMAVDMMIVEVGMLEMEVDMIEVAEVCRVQKHLFDPLHLWSVRNCKLEPLESSSLVVLASVPESSYVHNLDMIHTHTPINQ